MEPSQVGGGIGPLKLVGSLAGYQVSKKKNNTHFKFYDKNCIIVKFRELKILLNLNVIIITQINFLS
jgi:hypothetical protein